MSQRRHQQRPRGRQRLPRGGGKGKLPHTPHRHRARRLQLLRRVSRRQQGSAKPRLLRVRQPLLKMGLLARMRRLV